MVLLAGLRQCGKTTLAKSLLDDRGEYLNWDIVKHRAIIRELAWPKDDSLLVLDEFHNRPPMLVTGSARLDTFRNSGDALTGRNYLLRLHPIDVAKSKLVVPEAPQAERV